MDRPILNTVQSIMTEQQGVKGVVCAGHHGLPLASAGAAPLEASGFVHSIALQAQSLEPGQHKPTIIVESTSRSGKFLWRCASGSKPTLQSRNEMLLSCHACMVNTMQWILSVSCTRVSYSIPCNNSAIFEQILVLCDVTILMHSCVPRPRAIKNCTCQISSIYICTHSLPMCVCVCMYACVYIYSEFRIFFTQHPVTDAKIIKQTKVT